MGSGQTSLCETRQLGKVLSHVCFLYVGHFLVSSTIAQCLCRYFMLMLDSDEQRRLFFFGPRLDICPVLQQPLDGADMAPDGSMMIRRVEFLVLVLGFEYFRSSA